MDDDDFCAGRNISVFELQGTKGVPRFYNVGNEGDGFPEVRASAKTELDFHSTLDLESEVAGGIARPRDLSV